MHSGLLMAYQLDRLVPRVLSLYVLINLCLAAPGLPGSQREETVDVHPPPAGLLNPFGSGEDERRLLQSYIHHSLQNSQGGPEISSWEQEVFFLFRLYDYDRSGFLDGLEIMKLLSHYNSHHALGPEITEQVVSMVDFLLQTQDLNQDGLLDPSELLSPSVINTQGSSNNKMAHQEQELADENKLSNTITVEENAGAGEHREKQQLDIMALQEEPVKQTEERQDQEIFNALAEKQEQAHHVPVHQGQPEI
ncbi:cell growth regulator with EF hand domain protein 1-like [Girardinichthys multiradiatus]|uniref:cell growth regulator with EF hand domain protein 1-like n=1 Tax=Girardinichthys multiradiatus TaxID=208333 RepID=UPI001FAD2806|nr:cell growth regulator with EF hand domain protein 1-like [Girardinichthys multiradiatus]